MAALRWAGEGEIIGEGGGLATRVGVVEGYGSADRRGDGTGEVVEDDETEEEVKEEDVAHEPRPPMASLSLLSSADLSHVASCTSSSSTAADQSASTGTCKDRAPAGTALAATSTDICAGHRRMLKRGKERKSCRRGNDCLTPHLDGWTASEAGSLGGGPYFNEALAFADDPPPPSLQAYDTAGWSCLACLLGDVHPGWIRIQVLGWVFYHAVYTRPTREDSFTTVRVRIAIPRQST